MQPLFWFLFLVLSLDLHAFEDKARPSANFCPIDSLVVRYYLADFPELGKVPIVKDPAKVVHKGDVVVVVVGKRAESEKRPWDIMLVRIPGSSPGSAGSHQSA